MRRPDALFRREERDVAVQGREVLVGRAETDVMSSSASERTRSRALALRLNGYSYAHIGRLLRVSKQRVQQVLPPDMRGVIAHDAKTPGSGFPRCPWCRREVMKSRGYQGGPFCRKACWEAAWMSALPPATFSPLARSLPAATMCCPRPGCGGSLAREGAFLHCWCGGRWPITGAPLSEALEYERRSGARTAGQ